MSRSVPALFRWADGYRDYRPATIGAQVWRRFKGDRDDALPRTLDFDAALSSESEPVEVVVFSRVSYSDGSFEFVEKA